MPRLRPLTRADTFRRILFERTKIRIPAAEIARVIGKCPQTARNYINDPETMPLDAVVRYANAVGMTDEEWTELRKVRG